VLKCYTSYHFYFWESLRPVVISMIQKLEKHTIMKKSYAQTPRSLARPIACAFFLRGKKRGNPKRNHHHNQKKQSSSLSLTPLSQPHPATLHHFPPPLFPFLKQTAKHILDLTLPTLPQLGSDNLLHLHPSRPHALRIPEDFSGIHICLDFLQSR